MTATTAPLPKPAVLSWSTTALPVSMSPRPFLNFSMATPSSFQCTRSVLVTWNHSVPFPSGWSAL